jgi:hypothetical protein
LRPYNDRKLAFRSKQCVFLGYSNLHKGFKCLDPSIGKVYISCDVVFDEKVFPFSRLHPNDGARLQSELAVLPDSLLNSNSSFEDTILLDRRDEIPPSSNHGPSYSSSVVDTRSNGRPNGENPTANGAADRQYFMCLPRGGTTGDNTHPEEDSPGGSSMEGSALGGSPSGSAPSCPR